MTPLSDVAIDDPTTRSVPFARLLANHGDRVAIITPEAAVSYRDLAARVAELASVLGEQRRLVLLTGANRLDAVVAYLAALAGGHPVLLAPADRPASVEALVAAYDPDVVVGDAGGRWRVRERRGETIHQLHPDLALLLPTSGSTGSAKLVRLSQTSVQANAEAIATYLSIRPDDRAATSLPMHYCYGLSVINSHLLRGASLLLTDRSVTDPVFWQLFTEHGATSFAGVPYTFDLLDRVGFEAMRLPRLRYVTQAGGRLAPERVRRYAELGRRSGWDLFVMYGQTEATARMAYLPPDLALSHPDCIGVPIPGGSFRIQPRPDWPEPDTGELIYRGPNVMLGYAESAADLGKGRVVAELATGDIARRTPEGLYQIVGRRSRFLKLFGLRVDLQQVEEMLERHGWRGCCVGGDDELVVAIEQPVTGTVEPEPVRRVVAAGCGLPERVIRVCVLPALPRLPSGKPDYPAIRALIPPLSRAPVPGAGTESDPTPDRATTADLCRIYAEVLGRPRVSEQSSFVSLGGDSLSYVELSVRLERALGRLPEQWHTTPIGQLRPVEARRRRRWVAVMDTSVALRGIAIFLIVGTHATLFPISGGAHLLLGVAGFNFARFHLNVTAHRQRLWHMARSIARVALASATWITAVMLATDSYAVANVFLMHYVFGSEETRHGWHFWFIESLVYIQVAILLLLAVPLVSRLERRFPFGLPMALVGLGLVTRYQLVPGVELATPLEVFWLFALGWAAAKATRTGQRLLVSLAVVATLPGFFENQYRVAVVIAGLLVLLWVPQLPSLRPLHRPVGLLAGASLFIYLTHWQIYPHLMGTSPLLAVVASLVAGVAYAAAVNKLTAWLSPPARRMLHAGVTQLARMLSVRLASPHWVRVPSRSETEI